jgi:hypothetical protein
VLARAGPLFRQPGLERCLLGARRHDRLAALAGTAGSQIDEGTKADMDAILARCIIDPDTARREREVWSDAILGKLERT